MVRALLIGRKTMTRRVVKPFAPHIGTDAVPPDVVVERDGFAHRACPYGQPGDRLWVREKWAVQRAEPCLPHEQDWQELLSPTIRYLADGSTRRIQGDRSTGIGCYRGMVEKARPSIHMPRAASRLTLEITCVRVERLQDITEADVYSEGVAEWAAENAERLLGVGNKYVNAVAAFRALWESINGADSWDDNPFVWVVEFRRITKAYEEAIES
jgi:hypothetical protein